MKRNWSEVSILRAILVAIILMFIISSSNDGPSGPARANQPDERLVGGNNIALLNRAVLLNMACACWSFGHDGDFSGMDLPKVSEAGYLPYWVIDPLTEKPIEILREKNPSGTQVTLSPVGDGSWDYTLVSPPMVDDPDAAAETLAGSEFMYSWQDFVSDAAANPETADLIPGTEWDIIRWGLMQSLPILMDAYLMEHNAMPGSISDLLDGRFIIDEDFLICAKELFLNGDVANFEIGVIPSYNTLYFEYATAGGENKTVGTVYEIGPDGYDITDQGRSKMVGTLRDGERIVLLSDEMIVDWENSIPDECRAPLSQFYTAD